MKKIKEVVLILLLILTTATTAKAHGYGPQLYDIQTYNDCSKITKAFTIPGIVVFGAVGITIGFVAGLIAKPFNIDEPVISGGILLGGMAGAKVGGAITGAPAWLIERAVSGDKCGPLKEDKQTTDKKLNLDYSRSQGDTEGAMCIVAPNILEYNF